jgi:hypothetical protein
VLNRLAKAETRAARLPCPERPDFDWRSPVMRERPDLGPLLEYMARRAVQRGLTGVPSAFWPSDAPEMWPLLERFCTWFDERFPGRWGDLRTPFPERLPDGSWRSRAAAPRGRSRRHA